jgi:murein DD-endopeptidase MepM/ murein hydrolase activator NlpD
VAGVKTGTFVISLRRIVSLKSGMPLLFLLALAANAGDESSYYRYKDANGEWVYTDRRPAGERDVEQLLREPQQTSPPVRVFRSQSGTGIDIVVDNQCFCPIEAAVVIEKPVGVVADSAGRARRMIEARSTDTLLRLHNTGSAGDASFGYRYAVVFGDPLARHQPPRPYRAPFALAQRFPVTQAFPSRRTHTDAASIYAVDIAMPVGSQIFAAREGTVIEVAAKFFEGGTDPKDATRANLIRILHPDGTMALYAHLQWDSIRVRPGQIVRRGEYIANSGNIGFTTGPHLHFVVQKNSGLVLSAIPFEFADALGRGVTPKEGDVLIAY